MIMTPSKLRCHSSIRSRVSYCFCYFNNNNNYCAGGSTAGTVTTCKVRRLGSITTTVAPTSSSLASATAADSSNKRIRGRMATEHAHAHNNDNTTRMLLQFPEPIHILGAGSIGLLLAASIRVAFPSYPVKLLLRDKPQYAGETMLSVSLRSSSSNHRRPRWVHVPCETIGSSSSTTTRKATTTTIRNLFVTTKAFSAVAAVQSVRHRITPETTRILVFCNGALAVVEELRDLLIVQSPRQQQQQEQQPSIYSAITTHGVYRETSSDNNNNNNKKKKIDNSRAIQDGIQQHIVHAGFGNIILSHELQGLATLLDMAGLNCHTAPDPTAATTSSSSATSATTVVSLSLDQLLWYKLAANCVINPLTALYQCRNGQLGDAVPQFANYYYPSILREVAHVMHHQQHQQQPQQPHVCGCGDESDNLHNATTIHNYGSRQALERELRAYVDQVLRDTADNRSSMLQDVLGPGGTIVGDANTNNNVDNVIQTEIDYLSGYVVRTGAKYGIECPVNRALWKRVRALHRGVRLVPT